MNLINVMRYEQVHFLLTLKSKYNIVVVRYRIDGLDYVKTVPKR